MLLLCAEHLLADRVAMVFARRSDAPRSLAFSAVTTPEIDPPRNEPPPLDEQHLASLSLADGVAVLTAWGVSAAMPPNLRCWAPARRLP